MNDASMHRTDTAKDKIKEYKTKISTIPDGLTKYLQSQDVPINKLFKNKLKKRYAKYWIDQQHTKARVTKKIW